MNSTEHHHGLGDGHFSDLTDLIHKQATTSMPGQLLLTTIANAVREPTSMQICIHTIGHVRVWI